MDFFRCIPKSDRYQLDSLLLSVLDEIEECTGRELIINSAFRTIAYEIKMGRNGKSAHTLGKAVDIHCYDSRFRYEVIKIALQKGVNRIGVYKTFIHLDVATAKDGKTTHVIWHG